MYEKWEATLDASAFRDQAAGELSLWLPREGQNIGKNRASNSSRLNIGCLFWIESQRIQPRISYDLICCRARGGRTRPQSKIDQIQFHCPNFFQRRHENASYYDLATYRKTLKKNRGGSHIYIFVAEPLLNCKPNKKSRLSRAKTDFYEETY